ncbi:MAG: RIP metalloprotease RseP [Roseimicrobium sp.]
METLFESLRIIGLILLVLMVFNLMILVHEWGHFVAARWRGLKVEKFYVWFGKPLWKMNYKGVEYGLGSIPLGGFVSMPQMAPMEAIEGKSDEPREELPPITPLDKIIVAFAGPLFSFLLAVLFAFIVWSPWVGKPVFAIEKVKTIGYVAEDSPAERAGLKPGDEIVRVDGKPVRGFQGMVESVTWYVVSSENEQLDFEVRRPGVAEALHIPVKPEVPKEAVEREKNLAWWQRIFTRPAFRKAGIGPAEILQIDSFIDEGPHSPAQEGGMLKGDIVRQAAGQQLYSLNAFADIVGEHLGKPLALRIEREGKLLDLSVTPRPPDQRPADWVLYDKEKNVDHRMDTLGVAIWDTRGARTYEYPTPGSLLTDGACSIFNTLQSLGSRKSGVSVSHLSSALGIGQVYFNLLQDPEGWRRVLWFSVVLNVNLAMLNLLPFPVLDGGHITMALVEWIRRRPLNLRVLEFVQSTCVLLLLGLMGFLLLKDVGSILGIGEKARSKAIEAPVEERFVAPDKRPADKP